MAIAAPTMVASPGAGLWALAFRPFFLAAAIWAALALTLWIVLFTTGGALLSRFDPLSWHIHAMLLGFVPATIAGFMLTAIPNWTGRPPIHAAPLVGLAVLWLVGRIACLVSSFFPLWLAAAVDLAFPVVLAQSHDADPDRRHRRRRPADVPGTRRVRRPGRARMAPRPRRDHRPHLGDRRPDHPGLHPQLAREALRFGASESSQCDRPCGAHDPQYRSSRLGALSHVKAGGSDPARGRGAQSLASRAVAWPCYPPRTLAILHLGYAWVVLGSTLLGASMLSSAVPEAAAIHAFRAGAIGMMAFVVMTRMARGHTGRVLEADGITIAIYLTITAGAAIRVMAEFAGTSAMTLLAASAVLWVTGFGLFAATFGSRLLSSRLDAGQR